jgi:hypothetical protein
MQNNLYNHQPRDEIFNYIRLLFSSSLVIPVAAIASAPGSGPTAASTAVTTASGPSLATSAASGNLAVPPFTSEGRVMAATPSVRATHATAL